MHRAWLKCFDSLDERTVDAAVRILTGLGDWGRGELRAPGALEPRARSVPRGDIGACRLAPEYEPTHDGTRHRLPFRRTATRAGVAALWPPARRTCSCGRNCRRAPSRSRQGSIGCNRLAASCVPLQCSSASSVKARSGEPRCEMWSRWARFSGRPGADLRRERHRQGAAGAAHPRSRRARDKRRAGRVLDCATVVPELSGSEFFGHERGCVHGRGRGARRGLRAGRRRDAVPRRSGRAAAAPAGAAPPRGPGDDLQARRRQRLAADGTFGSCAPPTATSRTRSASGRFRTTCTIASRAGCAAMPPCGSDRDDILPLMRPLPVRAVDPDAPGASRPGWSGARVPAHARLPGQRARPQQLVTRIAPDTSVPGPSQWAIIPPDDGRTAHAAGCDWRRPLCTDARSGARWSWERASKEIRRAAAETPPSESAVEAERGQPATRRPSVWASPIARCRSGGRGAGHRAGAHGVGRPRIGASPGRVT